jgi:hypothetical protein
MLKLQSAGLVSSRVGGRITPPVPPQIRTYRTTVSGSSSTTIRYPSAVAMSCVSGETVCRLQGPSGRSAHCAMMPGSPFPTVAPLGLGSPPTSGTTGRSDICRPSRPPSVVPCQPIPCGSPVLLCLARSQGNATERHRENWSPGSPSLPDRESSTRS